MRKAMGVWRESVYHVAAGTSDTFYSEPVPPGEQWYLQRVSVRNDNTPDTEILVSIEAGTRVHPLYYFAKMGAVLVDSYPLECWLMEGERLCFAATGLYAGDVLHAWLTGHKHNVGQP